MSAYEPPTKRKGSLAPLVPHIRPEVDAWRAAGYPGTSETTARLLEWWFLDEHETETGEPFRYFFAQREAVESAIFLYEVARARRANELSSRYSVPIASDIAFPRYVVKMATGSGKTKVMSLLIAWAYLHATREDSSDLPITFLMVAPNVIVYERLRQDFANGRIFHADPIVPPEWMDDFNLSVRLKGDPVAQGTQGVLALTNIQSLYERRNTVGQSPLDLLIGSKPTPGGVSETLLNQIARRGNVMILNDEAHHLHDEVKGDTGERLVAWRTINRIHELSNVALQVDVSATPRNQQGQLFDEIISDYPLSEAIADGIVKRPIIGELSGPKSSPSDDASVEYRNQLAAGVAKWSEIRDLWSPTGRRPLLFVMAENTRAADQIADYLETRAELHGRVLTIHTNRIGEISASDLARARDAVRRVDEPTSPYSAIVSVLMLREGWDVRNVCVIVPLRPFTAKAQILPEQTLGRGLRRITPPDSGVDERLVVIEHEQFRSLWEDISAQEDLGIVIERVDDVQVPATLIAVEPDRLEYDIEIPRLPRLLTRSTSALGRLTVDQVPSRRIELSGESEPEVVHYRGRDMLTGDVVEQADYPFPRIGDREAVLAWYVNTIQRDSQLLGQFHILAPLVRDWVEQRAFGRTVRFDDEVVLRTLAEPVVQEQVRAAFRVALDSVTFSVRSEADSGAVKSLRLSSTSPFLWSRDVVVVRKSVFSAQACDNFLELSVCRYLDSCRDIVSFSKLARAMRFSLEFRNSDGRLAYYYPDFVVKLQGGLHVLLEAKGRSDPDVPYKDARARKWAYEASRLTGIAWRYALLEEDVFFEYYGRAPTFQGLLRIIAERKRVNALSEIQVRSRASKEELIALMDSTLEQSVGTTGVDEVIRGLRDEPRIR